MRAARAAPAWLAALAASVLPAWAAEDHDALPPLAPLLYELPAAGSYDLPVIDRVAQRELVGADGASGPLLASDPSACTVVAFVYLSCTDAHGCPLALAQVQRLDRELARRPELAPRVRLATVSFDPERDRPRELAQLRHHMAPKSDWRFFTSSGPEALQPVLDDFGQGTVPLVTDGGNRTGLILHVTKVFLVDGEGGIRNVYSTGFLDHRLILRDIETLTLASR